MSEDFQSAELEGTTFQPMEGGEPAAKPEYTPMPERAIPSPQTFKGDLDGLRDAASDLKKRREEAKPLTLNDELTSEPEPKPIERSYLDTRTGEVRPPHETVSLRKASDDLKAIREHEQAAVNQEYTEKVGAAVDELRGVTQPQPTEAEATPVEAPQQNGVHPDVARALQNVHVREAVQKEIQHAEVIRQSYEQATAHNAIAATAALISSFPELSNISAQQLPAAIAQIQQQNPARAAAIVNHIRAVENLTNQAQQARHQQQQLADAQFQQWSHAEDAKFNSFASHESPEVVRQVKAELPKALMQDFGIDANQLMQLWNSNPLLRSSAGQQILFESMRYRMAARAAQRGAPAVPKVGFRPGVASDRADADSGRVTAALRGFLDDPSPKSAGRALAERRRAQQRNR